MEGGGVSVRGGSLSAPESPDPDEGRTTAAFTRRSRTT